MRLLSALLIGLVFGTGIAVSGMFNPAKVLNFFDLAGSWDPSLAFVMGGALAVAIPGYRLVLARRAPRFEPKFQLPGTRLIDVKLVAGSAVFGIGWGIAGFCPGGALPALGTLRPEPLAFVAALICGLLIARGINGLIASRTQTA
ncbi:YeeE/YedE family protein [Xinfangfangia sp. CPCC 101601]|uniref:YeeE/YedE-like protein n=2 Tax=Paracoccaceae TaxID=31989 RepID=S5Z2M4_PARAH|nr:MULTISPECIES: DUF6691 family protein [Paracoccaceae]AGT11646.1 YeeE/YedE-like protein [Paracoccus aminophilus JCM 7686]MDQ2067155.1 YeeE/YedE family protein [Xinfangfangia sp. CPCC 101601]